MIEQKVSPEQAAAEVDAWLDAKRIRPKKREESQFAVDILTEAITYGDVVINEDGTITHTLICPVTDKSGADFLTDLTYKARLTVEEVQKSTQSVKPSDGDGRLLAFGSALTGKGPTVLAKMDTADYRITQSVAVFFA